MRVNYNVSVGLNHFEFRDGTTALGIAELLVSNFVPTQYNEELTVLIAVKADDEEEEEDDREDDPEDDEADY